MWACTYIQIYVHTLCICLFLYLSVFSIYTSSHKFTLIPPIPTQCHRIHPSVLPSVFTFVNFLQYWESSSYYVYYIYLLDQSSLCNTNLVPSLCGHSTHLTKAPISGVGSPPTQMPSSPSWGSDKTLGTTLLHRCSLHRAWLSYPESGCPHTWVFLTLHRLQHSMLGPQSFHPDREHILSAPIISEEHKSLVLDVQRQLVIHCC